eukprot:Hpha_TRINITY_DN16673_c2_g6::TRINITY_DN16673_c2_g6_i2::g.180792::m.180792/K09490/HSPA5, BIP; heat shock 70kDa protein 5
MAKVIERNAVIPVLKKSRIFSTSQDNQSKVIIRVFQGEGAMTKDNRPIGRFEVSGIPPAPAGVPEIRVTLEIDYEYNLTVSVTDQGSTAAGQKIVRLGDYVPSEEEIMLAMSFDEGEEDEKAKERAEAGGPVERDSLGLSRAWGWDGGWPGIDSADQNGNA